MSVNVYNPETNELSPLTSAFASLSIVDVATVPSTGILDVIYRVASDNWVYSGVELSSSDMSENTTNLEAIGFSTTVDGDEYTYTPSTSNIRYLHNSNDCLVSKIIIDGTTGIMNIYDPAEEPMFSGEIATGVLYPFYYSQKWSTINVTLSHTDMDANTTAFEEMGFTSTTDNVTYVYRPSARRIKYDGYAVSKITVTAADGNMIIYGEDGTTEIYDDVIVDGTYTFTSASAVTYWVGNLIRQTAERLAKYDDVGSATSVSSLQDIFNSNPSQAISGNGNTMMFVDASGNTYIAMDNDSITLHNASQNLNAEAGLIELSHQSGGNKVIDFKVNSSGVTMSNTVKEDLKTDLDIYEVEKLITGIETDATSSAHAYDEGDLLILGDKLYTATAAISVSDALVVDTNITATTVEEFVNAGLAARDDRIDQIEEDLVPVENGATASKGYSIGDLLIRNDVLYKAKTAITAGDSFVVNTNIETITLDQYIKNIIVDRNARLLQIETDMTTVDNASTASDNYAVGDLIVRNDVLYKVIDAITSGDAFVVDTNIEAVTIEELLALKQNKTLDTALVIDSVNATTVEGALGTLNTKKINVSEKGAASGVAELDSNGKVPAAQLPSYVDDVIEGYHNASNDKFYEHYTESFDEVTPVGSESPMAEGWYEEVSTGVYELSTDISVVLGKTYYEKIETYSDEITPETGKIYIDIRTNETFRWSGSVYAPIRSDLILGETSSTAYRGDRGKIAYDTALANDNRLDAIDGIIPQTASTSNKLATADDITNIAVEALHDVDLTNIQNGQTLIWDATNSKWINGQGGKTYTAGTGITIDNNDVISLTNGEEIILPINPSVTPTENGAIWITT